jgi:hypothetical protein
MKASEMKKDDIMETLVRVPFKDQQPKLVTSEDLEQQYLEAIELLPHKNPQKWTKG